MNWMTYMEGRLIFMMMMIGRTCRYVRQLHSVFFNPVARVICIEFAGCHFNNIEQYGKRLPSKNLHTVDKPFVWNIAQCFVRRLNTFIPPVHYGFIKLLFKIPESCPSVIFRIWVYRISRLSPNESIISEGLLTFFVSRKHCTFKAFVKIQSWRKLLGIGYFEDTKWILSARCDFEAT